MSKQGPAKETRYNALWPGVLFAAFLAAFGISWLNPAEQFSLSANYRILAIIAPENAWGILAVGFSAAWIVALIFRPRAEKLFASFSGGIFLLFVSVASYLGNPIATWALPTFVIGCGAIYNAARMLMAWTQR